MSIKIGVYEFFAYTIPGIAYLIVFAIQAHVFGLITIDNELLDLSLATIVLIALLAYVLGQLLDNVANRLLPLVFGPRQPKDKAELALERLKRDYCNRLTANIQTRDWPVLYMYIKQHNENITERIDGLNAQGIMLRNISLSLLLLGVGLLGSQLIERSAILLFASLVSLMLSLVAYRRSVRVGTWFYSSIYEAAVAYSLNISELMHVTPHKQEDVSEQNSSTIVAVKKEDSVTFFL